MLLAKVQGEFVWHTHAGEDEFFLVVQGAVYQIPSLRMVGGGEFFIVPRGVEHCPFAPEDVAPVFEPQVTKHTGD